MPSSEETFSSKSFNKLQAIRMIGAHQNDWCSPLDPSLNPVGPYPSANQNQRDDDRPNESAGWSIACLPRSAGRIQARFLDWRSTSDEYEILGNRFRVRS